MIDYVEIRAAASREIIGVVDTAKSIIWHTAYYDTGDFEIYAPCTSATANLLVVGNYVTRPNDRHVGIIEHIKITFSAQDGRMIVASGRMAKSILDRRVIYRISGTSVSPTILSGNVETAARSVITANAINCTFDSERNIAALVLGAHSGSTAIIRDSSGQASQKQVTYDNLLTWIDDFLREYGIGALITVNSALKLEFACYEGVDRSVDNTGGNEPVIFSQEYDSLISSDYDYSEAEYKNMALIGGEGEGPSRFCAVYRPTQTGIDRRELFIDASSTSKTYEDDSGQEQTLTNAEYRAQLQAIAAQQLATLQIVQTFGGEINLNGGAYEFGVDYNLGDLITIQDNGIGLYINTRILEITEVQDDNGYNISAVYGI